MLRIKKDDMVMVIAGKDKGKQGKVLSVFPKLNKALIENINVVKKGKRKSQKDQQGGIISVEMPIHLSNLMLVCKQCSKPARFRVSKLKDGTKIRECKKCGASL